MKKKLILGLVAVVAVVGGVAGMSAYEAHVINVTAHIENALAVSTEAIEFGTVFPQEYVMKDFTINLSESFMTEDRVDDVEYVINQKTKCKCIDPTGGNCGDVIYAPVNYATDLCPEGYAEMESLCPFLSKLPMDQEAGDVGVPSYYVEDAAGDYCRQPVQPVHVTSGPLNYGPTGWGGWSCPVNTTVIDSSLVVSGGDLAVTYAWKPGATTGSVDYPNTPFGYTYTPPEEGFIGQNDNDSGETIYLDFDCMPFVPDASGRLSKIETDESDTWTVDLKVPPVEGFVGQDWPAGCPTVAENDMDYGCDLWIEVTEISEAPED